MKSILVPYCVMKEDFRARDTGLITYTEVFDTDPDYNPLAETGIWLSGAHLDSRTVNLSMEIHGDMLKFSDYSSIVEYVNRGDLRGLVQDKIGQNMIDYLDILARNAFASHPNPIYAGGARASRALIQAADVFDPDFAELARTHLEESNIPGIQAVDDSDIQTIVCITTPRVIYDIRTQASSDWLEVNNYAGGVRKFSGEVGTWAGVRFVRTNRYKLHNHGAVTQQTTLNGATVVGQGAATTVDTVYTVGQSGATAYVTVADETGFTVGDIVTIHSQSASGASNEPLESDGTQETRRIVSIDAGNNRLSFDKPLLKPHLDGDFVTLGVDIHLATFVGGPGVVYGVGERPHPIIPPKYDDLMMVNRIGWRGFLKFQMFRPEWIEQHEVAGTTT
jgi:N4-gp56 family major capsid protein